jgi:antirestriction protein ArdC
MDQTPTSKHDVYAIVTDRIIKQLEQGSIPWKKPWTGLGLPRNLITKHPYRGINFLMLSSLDHQSPYYISFKQLKDLGGSVIKGQTCQIVVFWKVLEKEINGTEERKRNFVLRYHPVFNVEQCVNIPTEKIPAIEKRNNNHITMCDDIIRNMPNRPEIVHGKREAYYDKLHDYINMPIIESFNDSSFYYSTLFHELIHSTGSKDRLNRPGIAEANSFGSEPYSIEELVAEIGACYLNSHAGIEVEHFENNVAYINGWLAKLKSDKRFIISASTQAQRAVDYILNEQGEEIPEEKQKEELVA